MLLNNEYYYLLKTFFYFIIWYTHFKHIFTNLYLSYFVFDKNVIKYWIFEC